MKRACVRKRKGNKIKKNTSTKAGEDACIFCYYVSVALSLSQTGSRERATEA